MQQTGTESSSPREGELGCGRCKLVVLAIETGGCWREEAVQVLRQLTHASAREVPSFMRVPCNIVCTFAGDTGGEAPLLADLFVADTRQVASWRACVDEIDASRPATLNRKTRLSPKSRVLGFSSELSKNRNEIEARKKSDF